MITTSVIHVAILVYFSVSSGHGIDFDLHAGKKAVAKTEEKLVLVDRPFCEKWPCDPNHVPDAEKCGYWAFETCIARPEKEGIGESASSCPVLSRDLQT